MSETAPSAIDELSMDQDALVQAILALENSPPGPVEDTVLAYELSHHLKPYVDRLAALKQGNPEALADLDARAELLAIGEEAHREEKKARPRQATRKPSLEGPLPELASLSPTEQAHWIFMERFISLEQHEEILNYSFDAENFSTYQQDIESLMKILLALPRSAEAVEENDIPALQKTFANMLLIFRNPFIGDADRNPIPCTIENLRHQYPSFFYKRRGKPNWFENCDFYAEPLNKPQWVLCDLEYLNCTLRAPERKLAAYAKGWGLPVEYVHHKTATEDIYDRIICGRALKENLFAHNCNSWTATTYQRKGKRGLLKAVYTVQKIHKISIHGKTGTPHWRATRRLWPGVFSSISVP